MSDIEMVLATQPEFGGAQSLRSELVVQMESDGERGREARKLLKEARLMAEGGDLEGALTICGTAGETHSLPVEEEGLRKLVQGRRASAQDFFAQAEQAESAGDLDAAQLLLCRARALDRGLRGAAALAQRVADKLGSTLAAEMRDLGRSKGPVAGLLLESQRRASLPELAGVAKLQACVDELAAAETQRIMALLEQGDYEAAMAAYRGLDSSV